MNLKYRYPYPFNYKKIRTEEKTKIDLTHPGQKGPNPASGHVGMELGIYGMCHATE